MQEIRILDEPRLGKEQFEGFDLAAFARKTFGMYGGPDRKLVLEGKKELVGVVIDRFGTDVMMHPYGEDRFRATVTVSVSPQFYGWGLQDLAVWFLSARRRMSVRNTGPTCKGLLQPHHDACIH